MIGQRVARTVSVLPEPKRQTKLIVVAAFDRDDEGTMQPVFGPAEALSEDRAKFQAQALAHKHAGVVAWVRDADLRLGDYGPPRVLFTSGDVPEME